MYSFSTYYDISLFLNARKSLVCSDVYLYTYICHSNLSLMNSCNKQLSKSFCLQRKDFTFSIQTFIVHTCLYTLLKMNSGNCSVEHVNSNCYNALSRRQVRSVYLITYSRAQADTIASRAAFAEVIVEAFKSADPKVSNQILQWVCSEERHRDGPIHYHMAVKLERNRRSLKVRNYVHGMHGVQINFSSNHANHYSAWQYATKDDTDFVSSEGHPDLRNVPQTQQASRARAKGSGNKKKFRSVQEHPVCQYTTCLKSPSVKA